MMPSLETTSARVRRAATALAAIAVAGSLIGTGVFDSASAAPSRPKTVTDTVGDAKYTKNTSGASTAYKPSKNAADIKSVTYSADATYGLVKVKFVDITKSDRGAPRVRVWAATTGGRVEMIVNPGYGKWKRSHQLVVNGKSKCASLIRSAYDFNTNVVTFRAPTECLPRGTFSGMAVSSQVSQTFTSSPRYTDQTSATPFRFR